MSFLSFIFFYILSFTIIVCAISIVFVPKITMSLFFAVLCFFSIGLLYLLLNSPLNSIIQILLYSFSVSVIFAFAIMISLKQDLKSQIFKKFRLKTLFELFLPILVLFISLLYYIKPFKYICQNFMIDDQFPILKDSTKIIATNFLNQSNFQLCLLSIAILSIIIGFSSIFVKKKKKNTIEETK